MIPFKNKTKDCLRKTLALFAITTKGRKQVIQYRNTKLCCVTGDLAGCPRDGLPEVILAGRSNVGKSALINALADQKKLARISQKPGKTRQLIFFLVDQAFYLVDLPGYGYAEVSRKEQNAFSLLADRYLNSDRPIALVLLLLDIRIDPSQQDRQMIEWLESSGYPHLVIATKADKLSRSRQAERRRTIARQLNAISEDDLVLFSSRTKEGVNRVRGLISSWIETG
jgi:GTP-binding protein